MCCKKIFLEIHCSKTPCQILIQSCNGCTIKTETICSNISNICFCTSHCNICVIAKYKNQTISRQICLNCCRYQKICTSFNFDEEIKQNILLHDETYGFPIANAVLNFNQIS